MRRWLKLCWRWVKGDWWEVRRSKWPHADGWATFNPGSNTVLDTGLPTRERAQEICDELNRRELT